MNNVHTPEAIALAAGLIAQSKGDVAAARRAAGEAYGWLCTVDPTYKPEPVAQAADDGKARDLQRKLDVALQVQADTRRELEACQASTARVAELQAQLSAVQLQLKQALQVQAKPAPQAAPTPAPVPARPAPVAAPVPPPLPKVPVVKPPQAPASNPDTAHMSDAVRAWFEKRAANLEID